MVSAGVVFTLRQDLTLYSGAQMGANLGTARTSGSSHTRGTGDLTKAGRRDLGG